MMRRHVIGQSGVSATPVGGADVRGDALVLMEDLEGRGGEADFDLTRDERVRDAVEMAADLDVVIDVDAGLFPFGEFIASGRQRRERWQVERFVLRTARAGEFFERPIIETVKQVAQRSIEFGE